MDETLDLQQTLEAATPITRYRPRLLPGVTLTQQRSNIVSTMTRLGILLKKYPKIRYRFEGTVELGGRRDVAITPEWDDGEWEYESLGEALLATELTTAQLLAVVVLADDDFGAAAALADLLQEQGVDAITEARRAEREHVATIFAALAKWHDQHGSHSLSQDYADIAELIQDERFDNAVRLNEEERMRHLESLTAVDSNRWRGEDVE